MKIKLILLAFLLSQSFLSISWAQTKSLIVTIDQHHLAGMNEENLKNLPLMLGFLQPGDFGALGEAVSKFTRKVSGSKNLSVEDVIANWDESRAEWIKEHAEKVYDKVFIAQGDLSRDNDYMSFIWAQALEFDIVDYVSMVHGGGQNIKPEWNVPCDSVKIRMVYSEACKGGSGKQAFIGGFNALASAGHKANGVNPSASPFFSFSFLSNWFSGQSFYRSLQNSWQDGSSLLKNNHRAFLLSQLLGGYATVDQALEGSSIEYSYNKEESEVSYLNINSFDQRLYLEDKSIGEGDIK